MLMLEAPVILASLADFPRYASLNPHFPAVAAFLATVDLAALPEGRTDLEGEALYVLSAPDARPRPMAEALLEAHRTYIDVQVVLQGEETMGWTPLADCVPTAEGFDPSRDIGFFEGAPVNLLTVPAGHLAVFFPEDAHAPLLGAGGPVRKLIFKVHV